jgi:hypothetical protein
MYLDRSALGLVGSSCPLARPAGASMSVEAHPPACISLEPRAREREGPTVRVATAAGRAAPLKRARATPASRPAPPVCCTRSWPTAELLLDGRRRSSTRKSSHDKYWGRRRTPRLAAVPTSSRQLVGTQWLSRRRGGSNLVSTKVGRDCLRGVETRGERSAEKHVACVQSEAGPSEISDGPRRVSRSTSRDRPLRSRYERMRASTSGRKCFIRPWIGHAAASPRAQMLQERVSVSAFVRPKTLSEGRRTCGPRPAW